MYNTQVLYNTGCVGGYVGVCFLGEQGARKERDGSLVVSRLGMWGWLTYSTVYCTPDVIRSMIDNKHTGTEC